MATKATTYWAPSSPGDLADRWTILQLKLRKARDEAARGACARRLQELHLPAYDETSMAIVEALGRVNEALWDLEDAVRALMASPDQGADTRAKFVQAARSIPVMNDTRNHLKRRIDQLMGYDDLQDVKLYSYAAS
jgi:hypothetical protein